MVNPIVIVNVSETVAPSPSTLQKTGAVISQGGTTLGIGNYQPLSQASDLTAFLASSLAITSLAWASTFGGTVTATAAVAHGITVGEKFVTTIAGAVPAAYNGTYNAIATGASTFTYPLVVNPGTSPATTPGTYSPRNVSELQSMVQSFFGQGSGQDVFVLECGAGEPPVPIANLQAFINASPQFFYSYLVPRNWDSVAQFLALVALFEAPNAKTYFWTTTTPSTYGNYTSAMKSVVALAETPSYGTWPTNVITNASFSTGVATLTTTTAHGVFPGQQFQIVGILPNGYNGTFVALPGTTGSTLSYALASNPGAYTSGGTLVQSLYTSAGTPSTEFTHAIDYQTALNYNPSSTNKVTPFSFTRLNGATVFPIIGNNTLLQNLLASNVSYAGAGNEGGVSFAILRNGNNKDGKPFNYWYSVDWMQINLDLNLSNALINGSNNPINPLYYNQDGINRLQGVAIQTATQAIVAGMALGPIVPTHLQQTDFINNLNAGKYDGGQLVINAEPFPFYTSENPNDYAIGRYGGFSMVMTPQLGFTQIVFNLNVTLLLG